MLQEKAKFIKPGDLFIITRTLEDFNKSVIEKKISAPLMPEVGDIVTFSHWRLQGAMKEYFDDGKFYFNCKESMYVLDIEDVEMAEEKYLLDIENLISDINKKYCI
jgi:hypothetical protein